MAKVIRRRGWLITVMVIAAGLIAGGLTTWVIPPAYEASAKLIVNKAAEEGVPAVNWDTVTVNIQLIATYKELIRTAAVMDEVLQLHPELEMTTDDLIEAVSVESVNNTQVMTVTAEDASYERAALIVNTVAEVFQRKVIEIMEVDNVTILNTAPPLDDPASANPNLVLSVLIAMVLAAVCATGLVFLLEHLDDTLRDEEDVREVLGYPVLASIDQMTRKDFSHPRTARTVRKAGDSVYVTTKSN